MLKKKEGQVSVELVIILGFMIVAVMPFISYGLSKINSEIKLQMAQTAADTVVNAADAIYSLGPGTKKYVYVNMPKGVTSTLIDGNHVVINMHVFGNPSNMTAFSKAQLRGSIPSSQGRYKLALQVLENGTVFVGQFGDKTPPTVTYTSPGGTIEPQNVTLVVNTDENALCNYDVNDVSYDAMSYEMDGTANVHTKSLGVLGEGSYTYYVKCKDYAENVMTSAAMITFSVYLNLSNYPVINIEGPEDNEVRNYASFRVGYNVSSMVSQVQYCELIVRENNVMVQEVVDTEVTGNFFTSLDIGNYKWNVNCTDTLGRQSSSTQRNLKINQTLILASDCETSCNLLGLSSGSCQSSVSSCNNNCGLGYNLTYDCYAGDEASSYCTDVCCCLI